ncbi:MAG: hypothetical protein AB8B91_15865 [Rubripirellula sp.]
MAGTTVVCPVCEERFVVPSLTTESKPEVPSPPVETLPTTIDVPPPDSTPPDASLPVAIAKNSEVAASASAVAAKAEIDTQLEVVAEQVSSPAQTTDMPPSQEDLQTDTSGPPHATLETPNDDIQEQLGNTDSPSPLTDQTIPDSATGEPVLDPPSSGDPDTSQIHETDVHDNHLRHERASLEHDVSDDHYPEPLMSGDQVFSPEQAEMISQVINTQSNPTWVVVDTVDNTNDNITSRTSNSRRFAGLLSLAVGAIICAAVIAVPSVFEQIEATNLGRSPDAWTYVALLAVLVQCAIAGFAFGIPDWSTQWIAAMTMTGIAAMYAAVLALTMFASEDHQFVRDLGLQDEAFRNQAQPWCFLVICLSLILAFCYGRTSVRWRAEEQMVAVR